MFAALIFSEITTDMGFYLMEKGMNVKGKIVLLGGLLALFSCIDNTKFKVEGVVANGEGKTLYLDRVGIDKLTTLDSAKLSSDGTFKFKQPKPLYAPEFYRLRIGNQIINLSIDSTETVEVKTTLAGFATAYDVVGSQNCTQIRKLSLLAADAKATIDSVLKIKPKSSRVDSLLRQISQTKIASYKREATSVIFTDPKSAAAYFALWQQIYSYLIFDPNSRDDIKVFGAVATAYDVFRPGQPRSKHLKEFTLRAMNSMRKPQIVEATASKPTAVGAFEIELPDIHGNVIRLSSLQGKVVVLNFTAYRSKFSPALNMLLGEIYQTKKTQGLEVYQVSLDDDDNFWKVSASHLPWKCVRDINGSNTRVAQTFNVSELPTIFLINRTGEIVCRVQNPENLQAEISKLL